MAGHIDAKMGDLTTELKNVVSRHWVSSKVEVDLSYFERNQYREFIKQAKCDAIASVVTPSKLHTIRMEAFGCALTKFIRHMQFYLMSPGKIYKSRYGEKAIDIAHKYINDAILEIFDRFDSNLYDAATRVVKEYLTDN